MGCEIWLLNSLLIYQINRDVLLNSECTPPKDKTPKLKRRNRKQILNSDSDVQLLESDSESDNFAVLGGRNSDSDSSVGKRTKIRKRKTRKSSDTDSSVTERRYLF